MKSTTCFFLLLDSLLEVSEAANCNVATQAQAARPAQPSGAVVHDWKWTRGATVSSVVGANFAGGDGTRQCQSTELLSVDKDASSGAWATLCCHTPLANNFDCSGKFTSTAESGKTACGSNKVVSTANKCLFSLTASATACDVTNGDNVNLCCVETCKYAFQDKGTPLTCQADTAATATAPARNHQVSQTAQCTFGACDINYDRKQCCQRKCSDIFVLDADKATKKTGQIACAATAQQVSSTAYCKTHDCTDNADKSTCCQQKCSEGWEPSTAATSKHNCDAGQQVSTTKFCAGPTCSATTDKKTCCQTKCDATGTLKGFELHKTTATTGFQMCDAKAIVHPTAFCAGTDCGGSDKPTCCQKKCTDGFMLSTGTTAGMQKCTAGLTVHTDAYCAGSTCQASDLAVCCQMKCTAGWELSTGKTATLLNCPASQTVHTTAMCKGSTCDATVDKPTCCQAKCTTGFELKEGTSTTLENCAAGQIVSDTALCAGTACAASDSSTCCQTKCDATTGTMKGFEAFATTKTTGMNMCSKDLKVDDKGYCTGSDCAADASKCCLQKCTAGFKLKGATTTGKECGDKETVHQTAYCKGAACAASDSAVCCQQKCSGGAADTGFKASGATTKEPQTCPKDTTVNAEMCKGSPCASTDDVSCCDRKCSQSFKVKGGTGKESFECPDGENVAATGMCNGDCSSEDTASCCVSADNGTGGTVGGAPGNNPILPLMAAASIAAFA